MGTGRRLKEYRRDIEVWAVEPDDALHGLEGLKHMESSLVPGIYHPEELDGVIPMPTDEAWDVSERLAKEEGLLVGHSSGASLAGGLRLGQAAGGAPARQASSSRSSRTGPSATSRRQSSPRPAAPHDRRRAPHPDPLRRGAGRDLRARAPRLPERVLRHRLRPQGDAGRRSRRRLRQHPERSARRRIRRRTRATRAPRTTWAPATSSSWARACAAMRPPRSSTTRTSTSAPTSATRIRPRLSWTASPPTPSSTWSSTSRSDRVGGAAQFAWDAAARRYVEVARYPGA